MNVKDALLLGELAKGEIIAGQHGLSREVLSIEVMEVPEVKSWVTPGILVITSFYSIKDNPENQIDILKGLIDQEAAGLIIKLGRFINSIPEKMLELANQYKFPVITIQKDIPYIHILTPLYERLYEEKSRNLPNPFLTSPTSTLSGTIEKMAEMVRSSVYIEDVEGRLLYVSKHFQWDGWRRSNTLFSLPDFSDYQKILTQKKATIHTRHYTMFSISGFRSRYILPLSYNNEVFAYIHIPFIDSTLFKTLSVINFEQICLEISHLFIKDQLQLQKNRIDEIKLMDQYMRELKEGKVVYLALFQADYLEDSKQSSIDLIDFSILIRKELHSLINEVDECQTLIYEKNQHFYGLVFCEEEQFQKGIKAITDQIQQYNVGNKNNSLRVAVSSPILRSENFDKQLDGVAKLMEIGCKVKPHDNVYSYDKLGIYEILLNLTKESIVQAYIENILASLEKEDSKLMETLITFINENGNISKCAEKLFIHRRTMNYRLQRIQELLNMDLNDADHRFILKFCLMIKELS